MPTLDLSTYLADDALTLTGIVSEKHPDGKAYTITSPSAKMGLRLQRVMQMWQLGDSNEPPSIEQLEELIELATDDDGTPVDFHVKLMGDAYQQMVDDGVSAESLDRITSLVVTYYGTGSAVAKAILDDAPDPEGKPAAPNRAARRSGAKGGQKSAQASTGTATRTRRRASTGSSTSANVPTEQAKAV